ncbi:hypothetical protein ACFL03_05325 [Thermodesulfobacteriota bacterium]
METNSTSTKKLMKLMEGQGENNPSTESNSNGSLEKRKTQSKPFDFYQLGPSGEITDAKDADKIRRILKQIQRQANQFFSKHQKGRIRCKSKDYNIVLSKSKDSLIIKVKGRETGKVVLSQRIKVGGHIVT